MGDLPEGQGGYATCTVIVWYPVAPSGGGAAKAEVWVAPVPSVARTATVCVPLAAFGH
jgi:hypothetical protein